MSKRERGRPNRGKITSGDLSNQFVATQLAFIKVNFFERGNREHVEYDFGTGTYSWEYDGDHEEIHGLLEDGRVYDEVVTGPPPDDVADDEPSLLSLDSEDGSNAPQRN